MSTQVAGAKPRRFARLLAILSVACFWLLPFSPMIAIGAVWTTKGATGRSRNLALTGAALCVAYTTILSVLFVRLALQVSL